MHDKELLLLGEDLGLFLVKGKAGEEDAIAYTEKVFRDTRAVSLSDKDWRRMFLLIIREGEA